MRDPASGALLTQRQALVDAESVLLVDDDQSETLKLHTALEQGVGTHRNRYRPLLQPGQRLKLYVDVTKQAGV